jgi:hypothetical protein
MVLQTKVRMRLRVTEKQGVERNEVTEDWRKLHNELHTS